MSTTFISHRMFVAALNNENRAPMSDERAERSAPEQNSAELTVEQLAAFFARYLPDFNLVRGSEYSAS